MPSETASSSTTYDIPPEVEGLLVMPSPAKLTPDQVRGAACVWGGEPLTVHTAVDLGVRTTGLSAEPDLGGRWYPRACRSHIAVARELRAPGARRRVRAVRRRRHPVRHRHGPGPADEGTPPVICARCDKPIRPG
ncbi:hypothetical protein ACFUYG_30655, partial [Streptomyces sp. NPDC057386]